VDDPSLLHAAFAAAADHVGERCFNADDDGGADEGRGAGTPPSRWASNSWGARPCATSFGISSVDVRAFYFRLFLFSPLPAFRKVNFGGA
jgi:hypothetical protein